MARSCCSTPSHRESLGSTADSVANPITATALKNAEVMARGGAQSAECLWETITLMVRWLLLLLLVCPSAGCGSASTAADGGGAGTSAERSQQSTAGTVRPSNRLPAVAIPAVTVIALELPGATAHVADPLAVAGPVTFRSAAITGQLAPQAAAELTHFLQAAFGEPAAIRIWTPLVELPSHDSTAAFGVRAGGLNGRIVSINPDNTSIVTAGSDSPAESGAMVTAPSTHTPASVATASVTLGPGVVAELDVGPLFADAIDPPWLYWSQGSLAMTAERLKSRMPPVAISAAPSLQTAAIALERLSAMGMPQVGDEFVLALGRTLQAGGLAYAKYCQQCHGHTGDGAGPLAKRLSPLPRDFRSGLFKWTSTRPSARAHRDDLARVIEHGIPGTYMPSFPRLTAAERAAIVEYVLWLSLRGELEQRLAAELIAAGWSIDTNEPAVGEPLSEQVAKLQQFNSWAEREWPALVQENVSLLRTIWGEAQTPQQQLVPESSAPAASEWQAAAARGRELFHSSKARCTACHGDNGAGQPRPDVWLQLAAELNPQRSNSSSHPSAQSTTATKLLDAWGHEVIPRAISRGIFRGGSQPLDLHRRIAAGIKGTPMPAYGSQLNESEIWDLVAYVLSASSNWSPSPGI